MKGSAAVPVEPVEDIDDIVYVSSEDDNSGPSCSVLPGMIPDIKSFYPGEKDDRGRYIVTDKRPEDLPEPEENEENGRYALVIHYNRCYDGRKNLAITSIVVQSPLLKRVLARVLKDYPCMAPELDRLEFVSPFRPFVHRWQYLTDALNDEQDPTTKSHIQPFYNALKTDLELTLETREDFVNHHTITFNALWMIFSPGDIVLTTSNKRQIAARLVSSFVDQLRNYDVYRIDCEMIHADGEGFGWTKQSFDIREFGGMRKINDLPVYPLKFHPNVAMITRNLIHNGKAYEKLLGVHHKQYHGVALDGRQPYHVDSRIIIDAEAYKWHQSNHAEAYKWHNSDCDQPLREANPYNTSNPEDLYDSSQDKKAALTEEQLMLCESSVKGYSLRNKRWFDFFVDTVKDIEWKKNARDDVVLEEEQKDLMFSMTEGHCRKHKGPKTKGLNLLVCGPTGVGKTYTVESIAESLRAPLFYLTAADVDLAPQDPDLESPFTDLLEMCGRWNAILIFDEANGNLDGDRLDKDEGSEYSLLLRALESHSTAFFVTCTARAEDCMDDRFLSRFHVTFELPELTLAARKKIWQNCLESHPDISFFVDRRILANWPLNGREIANAVTAARTLAKDGTLEMKHLERVVPAGKRSSAEDVWASLKDKKKKKSKIPIVEHILEISEDPANEGDGRATKIEKGKESQQVPAESSATRQWVINQDQIRIPSPPPSPPTGGNIPLPEFDYSWGSLGTKKSKKGKNVAMKEVEAAMLEPAQAALETASDDGWGGFGAKKEKKVKKSSAEECGGFRAAEPVEGGEYAEASPAVLANDDSWGGWGVKKATTATVSNDGWSCGGKEKQAKEVSFQESVLPPVEVDEWDFWAASKKSKKGKKKAATAVIDEAQAVADLTAASEG